MKITIDPLTGMPIISRDRQQFVNSINTGPGVKSVVAGSNVTVNNTDPSNPIVSATGGGSGTSTDTFNEVPTGTKNGSNLNFTTAANYVSTKLRPYLNGQRLALSGDYIETGANSFQFISPPMATDVLIVDYTNQ